MDHLKDYPMVSAIVRDSQEPLAWHIGLPALRDIEVDALQRNLDEIPPRLDASKMHELLHHPPLLRIFQIQFIIVCGRHLYVCAWRGVHSPRAMMERKQVCLG